MDINTLKSAIGNTDIYLLDQILKNRYIAKDYILDAGCGSGRNIHWFYINNFNVFGIDKDENSIQHVKTIYPDLKDNFTVSKLSIIPFKDNYFNLIISNAVLHFAENTAHFKTMFAELIRVLKVNGSLFIRMTSNIGIENSILEISDGVYKIPDGTIRFLITKELIETLLTNYHLSLLEPLKTVNVNEKRCMTTLVLKKTQ